ncbi:MAG: hypothetical protein AAF525_20540 [Pseudomonadota bacterium]
MIAASNVAGEDLSLRQLGEPFSYDFDREQPHVAMKLRLLGDQLDLLRLNGQLESWQVGAGERTYQRRVDTAAFHALHADRLLFSLKQTLHLQSATSTTPLGGSSAELLALGDHIVNALDQTVSWQSARTKAKGIFRTRLPIRNALSVAPSQPWIAAATGIYIRGTGHVTDLEWMNTGTGESGIYERLSDEIVGMWNIAITDDGRLAAGTQRQGSSGVIVLKLQTGEVIFRRSGFESYWVRGLSISTDGRYLLSGDEKGWLRLWDVNRNTLILERKETLPIQSTTIDVATKRIAWGRWDGTVAVMDFVEMPGRQLD